jgi:hypothetical protein
MTDTLPCPLCGGPPMEGQGHYAYRVVCADCYEGTAGASLIGYSYKSLEAARRDWNDSVEAYSDAWVDRWIADRSERLADRGDRARWERKDEP